MYMWHLFLKNKQKIRNDEILNYKFEGKKKTSQWTSMSVQGYQRLKPLSRLAFTKVKLLKFAINIVGKMHKNTQKYTNGRQNNETFSILNDMWNIFTNSSMTALELRENMKHFCFHAFLWKKITEENLRAKK